MNDFELMCDSEGAFESLKRTLATPPVLTRPLSREVLYLYLVIVEEEVNGVLIREYGVN